MTRIISRSEERQKCSNSRDATSHIKTPKIAKQSLFTTNYKAAP